MSKYVFIESRDPFTSGDTRFIPDTAAALKQNGNEVAVFLVQNGVLSARREAQVSALTELAEAGIALLADDFSLRERGIRSDELPESIRRSDIETLVDLLIEENTKAIWH